MKTYRVGEWWVGKRPGSSMYYRMRNNTQTGQVDKFSLKSSDYTAACRALDAWWSDNRTLKDEKPSGVKVKEITSRYWKAHASKLKSAKSLKECLDRWDEFFGDITIAELVVDRQEKFIQHMRDAGMKPSSILKVLNVGKAAINRSVKRGELERAPYVLTVPVGRTAPKGRPLELDELVKVYAAASPVTQRFIRWAIGTAARPEAVLDLDACQIDWTRGLVDLLPPGRDQTPKKFRPVVRLPERLSERFEGPAVGATFQRVKRGLRRACDAAKVKRCSTYSFRHTAARWMRSKGVNPWEVQAQLGHSAPGLAVTERYASHSPDYLANAVRALDDLLGHLPVTGQSPMPRRLNVPEIVVPQSGLEPETPSLRMTCSTS